MGIRLKNIMGNLFMVLGALSVINGIAAKVCNVSFSNFFILAGVILLLLGIFERFILHSKMPNAVKYLITAIHLLTFLLFISFVIIESFIVTSAFKKDTHKPDFIVVLGAGLRGETPSQTLYKRLETSLDMINKYPDVKVVLSGGKGPGETITEAEAMKRYLVNNGVSPERIIKEEKSTDTFENLKFTRDIIMSLNNSNQEAPIITIITSNFHMLRSQMLAKRVGLNTYGYTADIHPYLIPTYFVREYLAFIKFFVFDYPS